MTSVASAGTSPLSGYDPLQHESLGDDETWAYVDLQGTSNPSSVGFLHSPETGSLRSWGVVGPLGGSGAGQMPQPSPPAPSPLFLDHEQQFPIPASFAGQAAAVAAASSFPDQSAGFGDQSSFSMTSAPSVDCQFSTTAVESAGLPAGPFLISPEFPLEDQQLQDFAAYFQFSPLTPHRVPHTSRESPACMNAAQQPSHLDIPSAFQSNANVPPWSPTGVKQDEPSIFNMEGFPPEQHTPPSSSSPAQSASPHSQYSVNGGGTSPHSPSVKLEPKIGSTVGQKSAAPAAIRKVIGSGARVGKRKPNSSDSSVSSISLGSSIGSNSGAASKFVIVTPTSINAQAGKPNVFECFDVMRNQRGRKGPLANEIKENALQVRRVGACFCCHARKVKCDAERPCKNCKKLTTQVPQIVCWQFPDFHTILFPDLIRTHFRKEEMAKFVAENVKSFLVDGLEKPCTVELTCGRSFATTLTVRARFFTPNTPDIIHHWRQDLDPSGAVDLKYGRAAAIGLEAEGGNAKKEELKKLMREYINGLIHEPCFPEVVTAWHRSLSTLSMELIRILQRYALKSGSDMVKRALFIYTIHYVMSHQLTLTDRSVSSLLHTRLIPQNTPTQTARLLNRQLKAVLDEMNQREMQLLFESFSKSLKPKMRKEWAPCMAAFLLLTMYMEDLEITTETFATSQNKINLDNGYKPQYRREDILGLNQEVEKMPFKQFAYQFHQIYQTHSTDASAKSFNPFVDDSLLTGDDLDPAATEMVQNLKRLIYDRYSDLDWAIYSQILSLDPQEQYPHARNFSMEYSGRLLAKFLLSFLGIHHLIEDS